MKNVRPLDRQSLKPADIVQALRDAYPNPRPRMIQAAIWSIEERMKDAHADTDALDRIHAILDGSEWDCDTTVAVADVVTSTGRTIREPDEQPDDPARDIETPAEAAARIDREADEAAEQSVIRAEIAAESPFGTPRRIG